MTLPEDQDPDSMIRTVGYTGFNQHLGQRVPLSDYLFDHLAARSDLTSLEGRSQYFLAVHALLDRLPESVFKTLMRRRLDERVGLGSLPANFPAPAIVTACGGTQL